MPNGDGPPIPEPPFDPEQAAALATLLEPLQQATGISASFGAALEDTPYPPVRLVGQLMQLSASSTSAAVTAAQTVPNAFAIYADAQERGAEALLPPPPAEVVADIREATEGLRAAQREFERR